MNRLPVWVSVVVLAVSCVNCANSPEGSNSILGPSTVAPVSSEARSGGGGGGGKGKPGSGTSATLAVNLVNDVNGNGSPNLGDTVTFTFSPVATTEPTVDLACYQNGSIVLSATTGFYAGYPWPWTNNMTLGSGAWSSGAASCTATLHALGSSTVLASANFTAGA